MIGEFQSNALVGFSLWSFQAALAATATFSRSAKPTHFSGWSLSMPDPARVGVTDLITVIDSRVKNVHTTTLDLSFNELVDMYKSKECAPLS